MESNLFNSSIEKNAFCNLSAARVYSHKSKEIQLNDADIKEYLQKCDEILKEYNARCNFIAEILAHKDNTLKNTVYSGNNRLSEKDALTKEFKDFLKTVPLSVKEDLEFYSKRIDDRLQRIAETSLKQQTILEYYPNVDNFDYNETLEVLAPIFDNVDSFGLEKEKDEIEEDLINTEVTKDVEPRLSTIDNPLSIVDEIPTIIEEIPFEEENLLDENVENKSINDTRLIRHEVIGIKTLPTKEIVSEAKEEVEINPFDKMDQAIAEIESEKKIREPEDRFVTDINFNLSDLEHEEEVGLKETAEIKEEPEIPLDTIVYIEDRQKIKNEGMVTFNMPKGISLVDIAVELSKVSVPLCGASYSWFDIYEANKDIFAKIVNEKNNGNFNDVENNPNLFSNLDINIPTVIKKDIPKSSLKAA